MVAPPPTKAYTSRNCCKLFGADAITVLGEWIHDRCPLSANGRRARKAGGSRKRTYAGKALSATMGG